MAMPAGAAEKPSGQERSVSNPEPGTGERAIETKRPGTDAMSNEEFAQLMKKSGGLSYSPDASNPGLTVTDWPEEGLSRIVQSGEPQIASSEASAQMADRVWSCVTKIPTIAVVPGGLQWGAEQVCEGDYAPQYIYASLQDTCDGAFCFVWETKRGPWRSPASQDYLRVSKVGSISACSTTENRKIRVKVDRSSGGINYGALYSPDAVRPCNVYFQ
jgi:hypothetical protein